MSVSSNASRGARFKDIFPGGFEEGSCQCSSTGQWSSASRNSSHFSYNPEQLYYSLVERYDLDTSTECIVVTNASYRKHNKTPPHEFIVLQVEDLTIPGLINYLVVDRTAENHQGQSKTISLAASQALHASDTFKVSYDGDIKKLLKECRLTPDKSLEEISFLPEKPLRLYELVTLSKVVSYRYPKYEVFDASYLFIEVIWESLRLMRPSAVYLGDLAARRGKYPSIRRVPSKSEIQDVCLETGARLREIQSVLQNRRQKILNEGKVSRDTEKHVF